MTLSGPEALRSLDEALRDIRREEDEIAKRLAKSAELVAKIREGESELFRQLAKVRLEAATQNELTGQLSKAEQDARESLKQHQKALAAAEVELEAHDAAIARLAAERSAVSEAAAKHEATLKALAEKVAGTTAARPEYAEKRRLADEQVHVAEEAMRKTLQAEADQEEKGRPYREDPLFMYLWERGYGTRTYRANNLVTSLDRWVAGLVRFPEARPNFAMLNEIPMRLREHAERQKQKAEAAVAEVVALEEAAVDAAGGKPVREALAEARSRMEAIDAEVVKLEDARDDAAQAQRELAQGSDPAFASAVSSLAASLGRTDVETLLAEARATRTHEDDAIVTQIDDARSRVAEEEEEARDLKARVKTLAARRRELEDIQFEFKKQGYDRPQSTFREDKLVGDLLNDFLRGGISAATYWDQWRRSQNWNSGHDPWRHGRRDDDDDDDDDRRTGPWGGGFQWPDSSFSGGGRRAGGNWGRLPGGFGGGSGGGFSRPRSGSAGTRRHGGFKTGGGF
jgi:hypothetical protein